MDEDAFKIVVIVAAIIAIIRATLMERRRKQREPNTLPFSWGYWCGYAFLTVGILVLLGGLISHDLEVFLVFLSFGLIWGTLGHFMVKRHRWALVTGTILTLNPVLWVANTIYFGKRWKQLTLLNKGNSDQAINSNSTAIIAAQRSNSIFLMLDNQQMGPYSITEVNQLLGSQQAKHETLYWHEGMKSWLPLSTIVAQPKPAPAITLQPPPKSNSAAMNKNQRIVLICSACLVLLMLALPPWRNGSASRGFHFFWDAPGIANIDAATLWTELGGVALIAALLTLAFKEKP